MKAFLPVMMMVQLYLSNETLIKSSTCNYIANVFVNLYNIVVYIQNITFKTNIEKKNKKRNILQLNS